MTRAGIGIVWSACLLLAACGDAPHEQPIADAPPPWTDEERAVALVVAEDAPHDFALQSVLQLPFGGVDVLDVADADAWVASLADRSVIVMGHDTVRRVGPDAIPALETFVRNGGALVLETPDTTWSGRAGVRLATAERLERTPWPLARDAAAIFGDGVRGGLTDARSTSTAWSADRPPERFAVPLSTWRYAPARDRSAAAVPRTRAAGRPAVWSRALDDGAIVSLAHHLGRFELDLARDDASLSHPLRDAWVSRVLESDAAPTPWPRWSTAPFGADGVVAVTPAAPATDAAAPGFPRGSAAPTVSYGRAGRPVGDASPWTIGVPSGLQMTDWLGRNASVSAGLLRILAPADLEADLVALADATGHATADADDLGAWWAARLESRLAWSSIGDFIVAVETPPSADDSTRSFGLLLPATWREETLVGWTATWTPSPSRRIVRAGRTWVEIAVPAGTKGSLRAQYRPRPGS